MNRDELINQLLSDEGLRLKPYRCTAGKLTIGVGRNLDDRGITQDEAMYLLANDVRRVYGEVSSALPWFIKLNDARQNVLLNMAFQMGTVGLLKFRNTLDHIRAGEYNQAATAMMQSLWARQTPARAKRLADQMRSGNFLEHV
jgi:lysozyme